MDLNSDSPAEDVQAPPIQFHPGDDDDDYTGDWQNRSYELFRKTTGDELFEQLQRDQFNDSIDTESMSGVLGGIGQKIKKTKYDLFSNTTLSQNGQNCCPQPVGGVGFAKVSSNPKFPEHDFFRAGRIFCVRLRHNNMAFQDDAMLDGRVVALKFCDNDQGGALDLILYTGKVSQFYNTTSFEMFTAAFKKGPSDLREWAFKKPISYYSRVEHVRRNPESYYDQRYYSHVTYLFRGVTGERHAARLRLVPTDGRPETGRLDKIDQENVWIANRWESDTREHDYLREEYRSRLADAPLQYRLQIQLRKWPDDETADVFNTCSGWEHKYFPWMDLALITVVLPLPEERLAKTRISLTVNQPRSFCPIDPSCSTDFNSPVLVLREFHGVVANSERTVGRLGKVDVVKGAVSVKTGKQPNAGTDGDVFITITGTKGRTHPINLTSAFHDDFEPSQTDQFPVEFTAIGTLLNVQVELRSIVPNRQWYLENMTVLLDTNSRISYVFPCYAWLTSNRPVVLLRKIEALLPQEDHEIFTFIYRKYELVEKRLSYCWAHPEDLPGQIFTKRYEDLPREAQFSFQHELDTMGTYLRTLANTSAGTVMTLFDNCDALNDYPKLLTNILKDKKTVYKVAAAWKKDDEFGRQFLNGPHPTRIRRMNSLPDNCGITEDILSRFMDRSISVNDEMVSGHLYIVSYPELEDLKETLTYKGKYEKYLVCPTCVLYVRRDMCLVPIAIQLHSDGPVWTPDDSVYDWLFAKMWVREADAQLHQVISRHLHIHLTCEVFALSAWQNLPCVHPVYKLIEPHLRHCIAANVLARRSLYPRDGLFDKFLAVGDRYAELLRKCYSNFNVRDLHIPNNLRARGVCNTSALPNYFYRDDALVLWDVITKYVRVTLMLHYWTSLNVQLDGEVQAWVRDIHDIGFLSADSDESHGVPAEFTDIDQLTEFITMVIFTASCQNAALTSGMMDYYAFCPNIPTMILTPPPTQKGQTTMETIRTAMPSRGKTAEIVAACYTLARLSKDQVFLGDFDEVQFDSPEMRATIAAFQEDLRRIQRTITERNAYLDFPYTYLMPDRIPKNISI